jgi:hypothetical protein
MEPGNMNCPHCGGIHPEKAQFCPVVGKPINPTCPQCGYLVEITWLRCAHCGAILKPESPGRQVIIHKRQKVNRIFTVLLLSALFLLIFSITVYASTEVFIRSENPQIKQVLTSVRQSLFPNQASSPVGNDNWEEYELEDYDFNEDLSNAQELKDPGSPIHIDGPFDTETPTPTEVTNTPTESPTITPTNTSIPSETPTKVPSPTVTNISESGPWLACPGTYLSRLRPGNQAKISEDPPLSNRVRSSPGTGNKVIGTLEPGERIEIVEGPSCGNDMIWWKIKSLQNDLRGWTSEGDSSDYWIQPIP